MSEPTQDKEAVWKGCKKEIFIILSGQPRMIHGCPFARTMMRCVRHLPTLKKLKKVKQNVIVLLYLSVWIKPWTTKYAFL